MTKTAVSDPSTRRLWTFEEIASELPESNAPVELWDGEIVMSPAPNPDHQEIVLNFATSLRDFAKSKKLGRIFVSPLDVVLGERLSVQPDVIYISHLRDGIVQDVIRGAPDLVVEVISRSSWKRDRFEKKQIYERFGVAEYWLVDPQNQTIEVFALKDGIYTLHSRGVAGQTALSKLLPGFGVDWAHLFA